MLGQIIAVVDGVYVAGKYQVLAINRGKRHGLVPGQRARRCSTAARTIRDRFDRGEDWTEYTANYDTVRLPDERSGTILLFTVYDRMSYGLVDGVVAGDPPRRLHRAARLRPPRRRHQATSSR